MHEAIDAADTLLQNFAAVGMVRFQDDGSRRHVDDGVFDCFASVESIVFKSNEIYEVYVNCNVIRGVQSNRKIN